jgi:2-oxoglutarate ferredoxin oxidoreductase subunit beta
VPLLKAAIRHHGAAFIDVVSPCIAFNNHPGSTKSYDYVREHNEAVNQLDVVPRRERITADYEPGTVAEVTQHDGSVLRLRKLVPGHDPQDRIATMTYLQDRLAAGEIVTGMIYIAPEAHDLHDRLNTVETPLNRLGEAELCPGAAALEAFNAAYR